MDTNPYAGINAHLNSLLQNTGDWPDFHTVHIGDLLKALKAQLHPMGYAVGVEQSLQIRRMGEPPRSPQSDLLIYDTEPGRSGGVAQPAATSGSMDVVMLIPDMLALTTYFRALAIYDADDKRGEPVAWIELLSPSNKPPHSSFMAYQRKRRDVIESGIVFVEIDYLHQSPPTLAGVADYTRGDPDAHPYRITVLDPRPDVWTGAGRSRQFDVNMPIPTVTIPLRGGDVLDFDFDAPYQKTFTEALYNLDLDYSQPPLKFETYTPADQARIRSVSDL